MRIKEKKGTVLEKVLRAFTVLMGISSLPEGGTLIFTTDGKIYG